jgi:hypothetical protein
VDEGAVGEASVVAVNSSVGGGVSVGGAGVNVDTNVGVPLGTEMGWNGVGVGDALGFAVTSTSGGGGVIQGWAKLQARRIARKKIDVSRRGFFISVIARSVALSGGTVIVCPVDDTCTALRSV